MKLSVNAVLQAAMVIAQATNASMDLLPPAWRVRAALIVAAMQSVVGVVAHFSNPDGTNAKEPYRASQPDR